jgi:hypothetical protein
VEITTWPEARAYVQAHGGRLFAFIDRHDHSPRLSVSEQESRANGLLMDTLRDYQEDGFVFQRRTPLRATTMRSGKSGFAAGPSAT